MNSKVNEDVILSPPKVSRFPILDNIHTTVFTPSEFQVEVLDAAKEKNIVICLASLSSKSFIVVMLVKEFSCRIPRKYPTVKRCWVLANSTFAVKQYFDLIFDHTHLEVIKVNCSKSSDNIASNNSIECLSQITFAHQVVVILLETFLEGIEKGLIDFSEINLLMVDECHLALTDHPCKKLLSLVPQTNGSGGPRIVGLSISVLDHTCDPDILEKRLVKLERATKCVTETSSNLLVLSRFSGRPEELVICCENPTRNEVDQEIRDVVHKAKLFLEDHVFNHGDIYGDSFETIPDPTKIPLLFLSDLIDILDTLGPWCADRAAWFFMKELKKLKDKIPYERHFLLISVVFTVMETIRGICDYHFRRLPDEKQRLLHFVTPKVIRLLEILRFYKPSVKDEQQIQKGCEISPSLCDNIGISHLDSSKSDQPNFTADSLKLTVETNRTNTHSSCSNCNCFRSTSNQGCDFQMDQTTSKKVALCHTSSATTNEIHHNGKTDALNVKPKFGGGRSGRHFNHQTTQKGPNQRQFAGNDDPNSLWAIVFVEKRYAACILNMYLKEMSKQDSFYNFVVPNFIMGQRNISLSGNRGSNDSNETQMEHRKQEEVLRRFRMHESNVLVATSVVEDGVDLPKCNLVVRFNPPSDYKSYAQSKGRAKAIPSRYLLLIEQIHKEAFVKNLEKFRGVEEVLLSRCNGREIPVDEEIDLKVVDQISEPYYPNKAINEVHVKLSSAIAIVNRYCARLPSDTFTRLVPRCKIFSTANPNSCKANLQLPINSPVKETIVGPPMQNAALAKMAVALETCKVLHRAGELDDNLMPMGKICAQIQPDPIDEQDEFVPEGMPRPGTTKRRQYYNKRIANSFKKCLPRLNIPCRLYFIYMKLTCAIPDEQNIRGRQIYDPSETSQGFGILVAGEIPEICGFPVFTRSGEVAVKLKEISRDLYLSEKQLESLFFFHYYTFASVLRLEKYPMCYDHNESENSILIVPIVQRSDSVSIDWDFVDIILARKNFKPCIIKEEERVGFVFDPKKYGDAVVMPWYRNLDQPQYFYVAELCYNLTPRSDFPDDEFATFENYYLKKYGIKIMDVNQPLLDVDHTSARLNLLTPRYVNRKGVALPTISEETKRAKRENLQQKQILVPELCTVHPFTASLWRKAVCLPCILYRLNCLLLADEFRLDVAKEIGLGKISLDKAFQWSPLDFGWGLSDVIKRQKQNELTNSQPSELVENGTPEIKNKKKTESSKPSSKKSPKVSNQSNCWDKTDNLQLNGDSHDDGFSIGTWSNDMAIESVINGVEDENFEEEDEDDYELLNGDCELFLDNTLMMLSDNMTNGFDVEREIEDSKKVRYGSPSNFESSGWEIDSDDVVGLNMTNIPGFGFISAPEGFNMDDLSRDLEVMESADQNFVSNKRNSSKKDRKKNQANEIGGEDEEDEDDSETDSESLYRDDGEESELWASDSEDEKSKQNNVFANSNENQEWSVQFDWDELNVNDLDENDLLENKICSRKIDVKVVEINESMKFTRVKSVQEQIGGVANNNWGNARNYAFNNKSENVKQSQTKIDYKEKEGCANKQADCDKKFSFTRDISATMNIEDVDTSTSYNNAIKAVIFETINGKLNQGVSNETFSFDYQPNLNDHPGPSPSLILQALTMSNANDGINLERLETIGDSFLKHAITSHLFCTYPAIHEGKLSHLRSKQVSNLKLYRLGRRKGFAQSMVATKFEPNDNWLPPGYVVPKELEQALIDSGIPTGYWNIARLPDLAKWRDLDLAQIREVLAKHGEDFRQSISVNELNGVKMEKSIAAPHLINDQTMNDSTCFIPYNLMSQHSIPDKSIADCVEAQIGAYLTSCGQRGALLLMSWLGIDILPKTVDSANGKVIYGNLNMPPSPLQRHLTDWELQLEIMLIGYDVFEERLGYKFRDRSYLLQAFTHASYHYNRLTDCYQRLEFLGDAVLDYLITRHLYEDKRQHSPGTLTDLRSALVNNTIFATLAVRYDFHKYFKAFCPNLFLVIDRFVKMQKENDHKVNEEYYFIEEDECEEVEDIEVPKALGDVFESLAGAIYLDSGMSLDTVWRVYYAMMKPEIEMFSASVPKSPIRELLEKEPETAKFGKPERTLDGKVRVTVEIFGKGRFTALGRNYRIAKCTAAKHALKALRKFKSKNDRSRDS